MYKKRSLHVAQKVSEETVWPPGDMIDKSGPSLPKPTTQKTVSPERLKTTKRKTKVILVPKDVPQIVDIGGKSFASTCLAATSHTPSPCKSKTIQSKPQVMQKEKKKGKREAWMCNESLWKKFEHGPKMRFFQCKLCGEVLIVQKYDTLKLYNHIIKEHSNAEV